MLESQNVNFAIPSANVVDLLNAPAPMSLSNLPRTSSAGDVVFGKGGLEVVKLTKTGNVVGVSIKNTTDSEIGGVLIRILYSEQSREADQRKKLERGIVALETVIDQKEKARASTEKNLKRLASINFDALTSADAAFLREVWPNLESYADDYRRTKRDQSIWTDPITRRSAQNLVDDDWRRLQTELASARNAMQQYLRRSDDVEDDRKKLSQWETTLNEMRSSTQPTAGTLVHYEDKSLGGIAPRMTRYYEFAGEAKSEWHAKAVVIDHVVAGQEKDKLITTGQTSP